MTAGPVCPCARYARSYSDGVYAPEKRKVRGSAPPLTTTSHQAECPNRQLVADLRGSSGHASRCSVYPSSSPHDVPLAAAEEDAADQDPVRASCQVRLFVASAISFTMRRADRPCGSRSGL